jgi:chaperonin cofactor prefoldin
MTDHYALAQAQVSGIFVEAALKEYAADWRKGSEEKTVMRDSATGQFAKKATSVTESVKDAAATIQEAIKDPKEAKRKVNNELLKLTAKGLDKLVEKNPEFADKLLNKMFGIDAQTARDRLADKYAKINPGLPNAIKPDPFKEIVNSISGLQEGRDPKELAKDIKRAFELAGFKYNKLIDDLNNVESESEGIKVLGKIAAASIPIAGYLAATLTPEIAIGMLVGDTLGTILVSAAATQAVSFAANKAMDKMDVKNPLVRLGIDLAIGIGVGSGVSAAAKATGKTGKKTVNKATEMAVNQFYETIKDAADSGVVEVCKKLKIDPPNISVMTAGKVRDYDYQWRQVINKEQHPRISLSDVSPFETITEPKDKAGNFIYSTGSPSLVIQKAANQIKLKITALHSGRIDFRGRKIRNSIVLTLKNSDESENVLRKIGSIFLKGELDEMLEKNLKIAEESLDFRFDTQQFLEEIYKKIDLEKVAQQEIKKGLDNGKDLDTAFKDLAEELENSKLPDKDGVLFLVSKGLLLPQELKEHGVFRAFGKSL